jgi:hypothetical protein
VDAVERVHLLVSGYGEAFSEACRPGTAHPSKDPKTTASDKAREGRPGSFKGPVWLWLVADGARWSYVARGDGSGLSLAEMADPPRLDLVRSV